MFYSIAHRLLQAAIGLFLVAMPVSSAIAEGALLPHKTLFYERHGSWEAVCDQIKESGNAPVRCYVQIVDVYKPRPGLRAAMMDVVWRARPGDQAMEVYRLDLERGIDIAEAEAIVEGGDRPGVFSFGPCTGSRCILAGDDAAKLRQRMMAGGMLKLGLIEIGGARVALAWSLDDFAAAYKALAGERARRDLAATQ